MSDNHSSSDKGEAFANDGKIFENFPINQLLRKSIDVFKATESNFTQSFDEMHKVMRGPHFISRPHCVEEHNAFISCVEQKGNDGRTNTNSSSHMYLASPSMSCMKELEIFETCANNVSLEFNRKLRVIRQKVAEQQQMPDAPLESPSVKN